MSNPTMRDLTEQLLALRGTVATLHGTVRQQEERFARHERRDRHRRATRRALSILLTTLLAALVPLATLAANPFTDLVPNSVHNANIDAIYTAGITTGCDPNVAYCPEGLVTRQEMASFLARTAGLGANPPVANAKTAQTATDAATVRGLAPSGIARVASGSFKMTGNFANFPAIPPGSSAGLDVATVTIVAPGPGFVLVVAAGEALTDTNADCPCNVYARLIDRSAATPAPSSISIGTTLPNRPIGTFGQATLANTHAFPVVAGARTYALNVTRLDAGIATIKADGTLTALFIPFGYDGGSTLAP